MTLTRDLAAKIKDAMTVIEANPGTVDAIREGEAQALAREQAEAKAAAERAAKAEKARPERAKILAADFAAAWNEAIAAAADRLAKQQVEQECGVMPAAVLATAGPPAPHLTFERVSREHTRILKNRPLPWSPKQSPTARRQSVMTAAQAAIASKADPAAPSPADIDRDRKQARAAEQAASKRAAGLPGW